MSEPNKDVVRKINRCFEKGDHDGIVACLDEEVVWEVPPHFMARGKDEFRSFITSPEAEGPPVIELRNMVAEGNDVAVEGYVENKFKGGGVFKARFHNAYRLRQGKIVKMTSYLVAVA
jgi:uncharacterized protein